jgi:hypothetical protein
MNVAIQFDWSRLGDVRLEGGKLRFPEAREAPCIYRFLLTKDGAERLYIGETDRLRRRFQHYRTPGVGQPTNIRLNSALSTVLADAGAVVVSAVTQATVAVDDLSGPLDLRDKAARLLVESAALTAARRSALNLENL